MFSYNNCERINSARYAEKGFMSWVTKTDLLKLLNKYGYEVIVTKDFEETVSWVEVRKPGELTTVKSHQALAAIVHRV